MPEKRAHQRWVLLKLCKLVANIRAELFAPAQGISRDASALHVARRCANQDLQPADNFTVRAIMFFAKQNNSITEAQPSGMQTVL
jgi:hypothetical protein